jgi:hypothetical protein
MHGGIRRALILFLLLCAAVCQGQIPPTDVLVGTDTRNLNSFKLSKRSLLPGRYTAETGGATVEVNILKSGAAINVTRKFREPGQKEQVRTYPNVPRHTDGSYASPRVRLLVTEDDGILVWEAASGVESMPDSLWFFLSRQIIRKGE